MAKIKPVKWSLSGDEPDDLQEFLSNEDLIQKHRKGKNADINWPGRGPFQFKVKRLAVKPNKNGDDRISAMLVFDEPKGSESATWNGYAIFDGFNVVDGPSLSFLKRFLKALGLTWSDFMKRSKQDDQDPPHIVQIGKVKFEGSKDPVVQATVIVKPADDYNDDEHMEIRRYLEPDDAGEDGDDADASDSPEEQEAALREELGGLDKSALAKRCKSHDKKADVASMKKKDMIEFIVTSEVAPF